MDKQICDVADMFKEASEILQKAVGKSSDGNCSNQRFPNSGSSESATSAGTRGRRNGSQTQTSDGETRNTLHQTLIRARNMVSESSSTGVFRRMNRRERLRSAAPYGQNQQGKGDAKINTAKKRQSKPIEFALLKCYDDADDEDDEHHLKWNSIIANGMIMAEEDDREENIRKKLKESLVKKFEIIGENDFEFVKVRQKKITVLDLGTHTEYGYQVVKKMAGQGLLYIKIKQGYDFVYNSNYSKEEDEDCLIVDPNSSYPSSCVVVALQLQFSQLLVLQLQFSQLLVLQLQFSQLLVLQLQFSRLLVLQLQFSQLLVLQLQFCHLLVLLPKFNQLLLHLPQLNKKVAHLLLINYM